MRKLLVTGCARSGTGYFYKVLELVGLKTGHEAIFNPMVQGPFDWKDFEAESSWMAARFLPMVDETTVVVHLHRHPALVIKSHLDLGFFNDLPAQHHLPYLNIAKTVIPNYDKLTPTQRGEAYWAYWNAMIESNAGRFDTYCRAGLREIKPKLIEQLLLSIDRPDLLPNIEAALKQAPTNYNNKNAYKDKSYQLPKISMQLCYHIAYQYGYDPNG